ncbi:MAG TPA: hypothetical protein VMW76_09480 [Bacteroidales bacterium]|nr:hypothetical protein [Bacteroidales bacterium]
MKRTGIYQTLGCFLLAGFISAAELAAQEQSPLTNPEYRETVWINSDRHLYISGEEVNFTAYLLEADTYLPSALSKILRVELLDSTGNNISRQKFEIIDGMVTQSISLPASLRSGWYFLRGYTNWMRNFPESNNCFLPVKVVNPGSTEELYNYGFLPEVSVELIPEQGRLKEGISDKIVIRATGRHGGGLAVNGVLHTSDSDMVIPFKTDRTGWTMFKTTRGNLDDLTVSVEGFNARLTDLVIHEYSATSPFILLEEYFNNVSVKVQLPPVGDTGSYKLLVHSSGTIYWYDIAKPEANEVEFIIPAGKLPEGITQFTILDDQNSIVAKKLWIGRNAFAPAPEIGITDEDLSLREKRDVRLIVPSGRSTVDHESLVVLVKKAEPEDPLKYYIPGLPGWPASYEIPADPEARKAWLAGSCYPENLVYSFFRPGIADPVKHNYDQRSLTDIIEKEARFVPETRGVTLNGAVVNNSTGKGIQNIFISTTILNDNTFYADKTYSSGRFHFTFPASDEPLDMIVSFIEKPDTGTIIRVESDFDNIRPSIRAPDFVLTEADIRFIRELNVNQQIKDVYTRPAPVPYGKVNEKKRKGAFFGKPDKTVVVDDFIKLPNMREVIFEVVPNVFVRKNNNEYYLNVIGEQLFSGLYKPVFLLDGVPLLKFNEFLDLPPDRLKLIEVKNQLYIHGNATFAGAVNFISVNGDLAGLDLPEKSQLLSLGMAQRSEVREAEVVADYPANLPLLSNTLLWDLNFQSLGNSINFTTNDNYGDYNLTIYGFNKSGQWVYGEKGFTVSRYSSKRP